MSTELVHLNPETKPLSRQIVTVQCHLRSADRRTRRDCLRATSPAVQSGPRFRTTSAVESLSEDWATSDEPGHKFKGLGRTQQAELLRGLCVW
jgi:hypothetical protein